MYNTEKPLISVIVPAYNHELWVKETILSIVNQTYGYEENIQLIVSDDCSTDKTPEILKELSKIYDFQLIQHQQNMGVCSTFNELISFCKGKYIAGIASDDIMFLDRIENQVRILNNKPDIDILAGNCSLIDKYGKTIYSYPTVNNEELTTYNFEDLFLRLKPGFPASSVIIKRELFLAIGAFDPNYKIEDYYFWLKATYNKAKVVRCNIPVTYYRLHQASISSNTEIMEIELKKILDIYNDHPKYHKAIQNYDISNISRKIFTSKSLVTKHLIKNPKLFLNRRILKILAMLIIPNYLLKRKFIEDSFRNATT